MACEMNERFSKLEKKEVKKAHGFVLGDSYETLKYKFRDLFET